MHPSQVAPGGLGAPRLRAASIVAEWSERSAEGLSKEFRVAPSLDEWILLRSPKDHGYSACTCKALQAKLAMEAQAANLSERAHQNEVGLTCRLTIAY